MSEQNEDQRWENARNLVSNLGTVPATFSALIRSIRSDLQKKLTEPNPITHYELNRLIRGPAVLAPMTYAALEFKADSLGDTKQLPKALINAFSLDEIAGLVGCLYLTRQAKKRIDTEEWNYIADLLAPLSTLAGHLGVTIPAIGFERAISAVTFTILGVGLLQPSLKKEFVNYRRILKKASAHCNPQEEEKLFNCSCREIGSLISQSIAQSPTLAAEFLAGPVAPAGTRPQNGIQALNVWLFSLMKNGQAPQEAMDAKWFPVKSKVEQIEAMAKRCFQNGSKTSAWILKESADFAGLGDMLNQGAMPIDSGGENSEAFEEGA